VDARARAVHPLRVFRQRVDDARQSDRALSGSLIAVAPARKNLRASSMVVMPPMPTIGIETACVHSHTFWRAMGRIAGGTPRSRGPTRLSVSIEIDPDQRVDGGDDVAPPCSAARATKATLVMRRHLIHSDFLGCAV
jgi:hypothetical protein